MKSFDSFWSSISEDELCNIAEIANQRIKNVTDITEDPQNLLGNQIAVANTSFIFEILSRYHTWLVEQLGQHLAG